MLLLNSALSYYEVVKGYWLGVYTGTSYEVCDELLLHQLIFLDPNQASLRHHQRNQLIPPQHYSSLVVRGTRKYLWLRTVRLFLAWFGILLLSGDDV